MYVLASPLFEALALLAASYDGNAAGAGRASAVIIEPLSVTPERPLDFGVITRDQRGPWVVAPTDPIKADGSGPAQFLVKGGALRHYRVSPEPGVVAVGRETSFEVPVSDLTVATKNLGRTGVLGRLDASGWDQVSVGGTISLPEDTPADRFVADVLIVVEYE